MPLKFEPNQLCPYHGQPTARYTFFNSKRKKKKQFCFFCQLDFAATTPLARNQARSENDEHVWSIRYKLSETFATDGILSENPLFPMGTHMRIDSGDPQYAICAPITQEDAELLVGKEATQEKDPQFWILMNAQNSYVFAPNTNGKIKKDHIISVAQKGKWDTIWYHTHGWKVTGI